MQFTFFIITKITHDNFFKIINSLISLFILFDLIIVTIVIIVTIGNIVFYLLSRNTPREGISPVETRQRKWPSASKCSSSPLET